MILGSGFLTFLVFSLGVIVVVVGLGIQESREVKREQAERETAADRYARIVAQNEADRERGSGIAWWVDPATERAQREASYARSVAGWWKD